MSAFSTRNSGVIFNDNLNFKDTFLRFVKRVIIIFVIICLFMLQKTIATALVAITD